jgi:glycosyltransferase involved in cell wall biosynthesis
MNPTITTIIPTHNRARYVVEAIESALPQLDPGDEIIVVDDGSTDNTRVLLATYGPQVKYLWQENAGPSVARNMGMNHARGEFVAFLDSDDLWPQDKIVTQRQLLRQYPETDLIFGLETKFTSTNGLKPPSLRRRPVYPILRRLHTSAEQFLLSLTFENVVPTSTALFRRDCIVKIGLMDQALWQAEDYDFWLRFAIAGFRARFIDKPLVHRRLHEGNLVNHWEKRTLSTVAVLERYLSQTTSIVHKRLKNRIFSSHYDIGSYYLATRHYTSAASHLRRAKFPDPRRCLCITKLIASTILARYWR